MDKFLEFCPQTALSCKSTYKLMHAASSPVVLHEVQFILCDIRVISDLSDG